MAQAQRISSADNIKLNELRQHIHSHALTLEQDALTPLIATLSFRSDALKQRIHDKALQLVASMREHSTSGVEALLQEYRLDQKEGLLIMCLAEALLRVPDALTAERLIEDKFINADWERYIGNSDSFFVNASSWGLMLTGKVIELDKEDDQPSLAIGKLVHKLGLPVIRQVLNKTMAWMGTQFILGTTIEAGVKNARNAEKKGYTHSYDMLGEGARTIEYADAYTESYLHAIHVIGKQADKKKGLHDRPSISIKLSALHPNYKMHHRQQVMDELLPRLKKLMLAAKTHNLMAAIDAEEANRLELSLDIFETLIRDADFDGWNGISLVVQAYQKRAIHVINWVIELARDAGKHIPVRLVKGAYWDTEIKHAQIHGLEGYPVFTRKFSTDISYLACAQTMLQACDALYPQFASHNAHTVASILEMAPADAHYEFQRLEGMGGTLYEQLIEQSQQTTSPIRCRIYAPIGEHKDLLAYLVRRLLENGANSSFVNQLGDKNAQLERIIADPVSLFREQSEAKLKIILLPKDIYGDLRENSRGFELGLNLHYNMLHQTILSYSTQQYAASSLLSGKNCGKTARNIQNPANHDDTIGTITEANPADVTKAMDEAVIAYESWSQTRPSFRAQILRRVADLFDKNYSLLMSIIMREGGRTVQDAIDEVREAIDFCRYYATEVERLAEHPMPLPGPTGELNQLSFTGRGVFYCISPWNFPLAIFVGQIAAALAAGNSVVAKPAEQTPIIAWQAIKLMHEAGIPPKALHLMAGDGASLGKAAFNHPALAGVAFTGSTEVAKIIHRHLAARDGAILPLIAETGGLNAMIVDSTALPEQLADDVVLSAFGSAGQRCSALRVLMLQEETADNMIEMISGALQMRHLGQPLDFATDIGPVIDAEAQSMLENHIKNFSKKHRLIARHGGNKTATSKGSFVPPAIIEINKIGDLSHEIFGPVLHVMRYNAKKLDALIDDINRTGYGLTLGIHSRIDSTAGKIATRARVGNIYINRSMTGAVVGVQPFGGMGLSGTGFKAGGAHYLLRFMSEKTLTNNIAAVGGNIALFTA